MDNFMETTKATGHVTELKRLSDNHEVVKDGMGKLVFAPLDLSIPGKVILDSATADGTWLRDLRSSLSSEHQYYGIDVEPELFPSDPEGITFRKQSITESWPNEWNGSFDLIHQRFALVVACQTSVQDVVNNLVALCKPGGWIQLVEQNVFEPPKTGPAMSDIQRLMEEIFSGVGVGDFAQNLKPVLEEAGLKNVQEQRVRCRYGKLAKKELVERSINATVTAVAPLVAVTKNLPTSFTPEQLGSLKERLVQELKDEGGEFELVVAWGQKAQ